jgi:dienelactone hydrolase
MRIPAVLVLACSLASGQADDASRLNQHRVANRNSPAPEPGAETQPIPSLIDGLHSAGDWEAVRRPQLLRLWTTILGKLGPTSGDLKWFGDIRQAVIHDHADRGSYTRTALDLPIEKDFLQHHVLLEPKGPGPFPAVICWASTTPDYTAPEEWWGKWLAEHGYVVLTSWSFIRHYRDGSTYHDGAGDKLYDRFGHWLPIAKMVHDAQREAEYLRSLKQVDASRIGFMGFSLSAKAAVYIGAFAPEIAATVAIDPHIAINGGTNWFAPWYLDWQRPFADIPTPQHTVLSMLDPDPARPGFEHDHHELLALAAPRPFLLIGGAGNSEDGGGDSDDRQSWGYYNRAKEVYRMLGVPDRLRFVLTTNGHKPTGPAVDPEWRAFFDRWLRPKPAPPRETYLRYLEEGVARVEARLAVAPAAGLKELETEPGWRHFPSALLAAAVLAKQASDADLRRRMLHNAGTIGDLLVREHESGYYASRLDHHRDTYMWLDSFRLLKDDLDPGRSARWQRALLEQVTAIVQDVARLQDYPAYQSPFIGTSPNHFSLWSSTVYLAARIFAQPDWEKLSSKVLHRFAAAEQSPDGYWGEHSSAGPTTGYDYLTSTAIALYWELSRDPAALEALRRATSFHEYFTWPDGTPVETINDRNRYWPPSMWGHFGFSNFPDGRRYAEFLTSFYSLQPFSLESLGRLAQNALYWHDGPAEAIPQDRTAYARQMTATAGMRKSGPWTVCLSGIVATQAQTNQFYLDRQGNLSVFHDRLGLIITGANSKRQPELATFYEHAGDVENHLPLSSRLKLSDAGDRLALSYNTFFAEFKLPPFTQTLALDVAVTSRSRAGDRGLVLQLCLKAGQFLETEAGTTVFLTGDPLVLQPPQIGGWIHHNGWLLKAPPGARLEWPVRPYNPYSNAPEPGIEHAVGVWTLPLEPKSQVLSFSLEAK